jgi:long-chain acyl-CoA synthetase
MLVMNLATNLANTATTYPERVAIRLDDVTISYAMLNGAAMHAAGLLGALGVRPGDRVGVMLPNVPQFAVLYYGILRAGAVVVPMNPLLKEREVAHYLGDSGTRLMFAWHGFADEAQAGARQAGTECVLVDNEEFTRRVGAATPVAELVERDAQDTAVLLYTSGTTGRPKGAELTHANLTRNIEIMVNDLIDVSERDVVFGGLPLFHVFGQTGAMNAAVRAGAELTLLPRFDPRKALEVCERDRVTVFEGVPTMYMAMVNHPDREHFDLTPLRVCVTGGAPMPVEVMMAFEKAFDCVVLEGYGLSETSPAATFNVADKRKPGTIGLPVNGVDLRLVDDDLNDVAPGEIGEIAIRGHNVMKGYWNKPDETARAIRDGWFLSGDLGKQDEEGYYLIVDRKKDMIIRGGYNVYPREIEDVLYEHPAIAEAAVLGVPHPELGEEVGAAVTLKPGAATTPEELRDFVKERVAAYKYPRVVRIDEALPKTATGKIMKREISLS